jgi:hypothetical protein
MGRPGGKAKGFHALGLMGLRWFLTDHNSGF